MTAMLSRAARTLGSCGILHRVPTLLGWTSGFGGGSLVFAPPPVPFFPEVHEELTRSWKAPFTARNKLVAPPPSPPSMVEPLWGTRASPLWSGLWPCNCVQQSLPLCGVNRVSPHGPVSTRQASLAVLIEPVGRRLLPTRHGVTAGPSGQSTERPARGWARPGGST